MFCTWTPCFPLRPVFSTRPRVFHHQTPCFPVNPVFSTPWEPLPRDPVSRVFHLAFKIRLFGFPETLVMRHATTAARNLVSFATLIGPFEFEREREGPLNLSARPKFTMDQTELRMKPRCERPLSHASSQGFQESRRGKF